MTLKGKNLMLVTLFIFVVAFVALEGVAYAGPLLGVLAAIGTAIGASGAGAAVVGGAVVASTVSSLAGLGTSIASATRGTPSAKPTSSGTTDAQKAESAAAAERIRANRRMGYRGYDLSGGIKPASALTERQA
jgi:hypothetical protein